jgi:hypothetical protein
MKIAFHNAFPVIAAVNIAKLFAVAISLQIIDLAQLRFDVSIYILILHE